MQRRARGGQWSMAAAAAAAATGAGYLLDARMSVAGLSMVYLVAVVATAAMLERGPAVLASVLCVTALNYFFVPPRYSFEVDGAEYWWTLAVLLLVSIGLNAVIASLRAREARAQLASVRAAQLHSLAQELATSAEAAPMATIAARWLHAGVGVPAAVFTRDAEGEPMHCFAMGAPPGDFDTGAAAWAVDNGRALGRGCDDWRDLPVWCAPFLPRGGCGAVQLRVGRRSAAPSGDEQQHWGAIVREIGLAIERARATAAARAAQESARAEAARNMLLASLSHDLRTPLAGILGTASTLRTHFGGIGAKERDQLLANLEDEARALSAMADNVLQLARLSQPHAQLRRQWESVEEVLGTAVARARKRWPQARVLLRVTPALPPVLAEAALLEQVIANLLDNAVRHSPGGPRLEIAAGRARAGVFIAVRDHGEGLQGDPVRLFEQFRQGDSQRDRGAAGLGLAICKLVVEAHGGTVAARDAGPGTEFRIELPAATRDGMVAQ